MKEDFPMALDTQPPTEEVKGDLEKLRKDALLLEETMITLRGTKDLDSLMKAVMDMGNKKIEIPSVSKPGRSYTSRYLVFVLNELKEKRLQGKILKESDFLSLPSYGDFRDKVKDLFGFAKTKK